MIEQNIEVSGLRKRFGATQASDGMTFTVQPRQVTGFVGPNGAGKSTTMAGPSGDRAGRAGQRGAAQGGRLLALGIATIIRDTAASIGAVFGLLYLPPIAAQLIQDPTWRRHIQQVAPMTAGLAVQATRNLNHLPIAPWGVLGVLGAWAAAALLAAVLLLQLRDA